MLTSVRNGICGKREPAIPSFRMPLAFFDFCIGSKAEMLRHFGAFVLYENGTVYPPDNRMVFPAVRGICYMRLAPDSDSIFIIYTFVLLRFAKNG